jgi:DNA-binding transcriptional LysR family regulator
MLGAVELRELRVLVAVAEHGTVARAARALHQSPSSVSHALASLEAKVGVRLFVRLPRGMAPTEAGEAMLVPARRSLREADAARAAAAAVEGLLAGQITIVSLRMTSVWLADLVAAFHAEHPLVLVSVHRPERDEHVPELVRAGVCELGVMHAATAPRDLEATPVATQTGAVIVPADHPLARLTSVELPALDGAPFVIPSARLDPAFEELFRRAGITPRIVAEADDAESIFELVRAGVGVAIVPLENAGPIVGRGAVAVPIVPPLRNAVAMVARGSDALGPAASAFRALAVHRFAAET